MHPKKYCLVLLGLIFSGLNSNLAIANDSTNRSKEVQEYRQQGLAYRSQGDFQGAIAALTQSVNLAPADSGGYLILGWTQHLAGESEAAAKSLWRAIWLKPQLVEAANALGIVYLVRGELNTAILTHQWAGFFKAKNEIASYNLSLAYQQQREFPLAIAYAKIAINLEPKNPHPLVSLSISHWEDGDQISAKSNFQAAIDLDSRYRDPQFLDFLNESGFSTAQILTAKSVLAETKRAS
jgi:tetratricopeptide (TPR) repeat protein